LGIEKRSNGDIGGNEEENVFQELVFSGFFVSFGAPVFDLVPPRSLQTIDPLIALRAE
jgi:hypothetical protein